MAGRGDGDDAAGDVIEQQVGEREVAEVVGAELQLEAVVGGRSGGTITPALLISRSISPSQPSANARTEARSARSSGRTSTLPGMPAAALAPFSALRTARTTRALRSASAVAAARPMPLLAPVTIAVRPL